MERAPDGREAPPRGRSMTDVNRTPLEGFEYDWLACDRLGHVALLSTAGGGYAPAALVADVAGYDRAIGAIRGLSATTVAKVAPALADGLPNVWKEVAQRGLYAFDSDVFGGAYRLVAVPGDAVHVDELPAEVAALVKRVRMSAVEFGAVRRIPVEDDREGERRG